MKVIDIPALKDAVKHTYVFEQFGAIAPGESLYLKNDHDPKPLYYQMVALLGEVFDWKYLKRGPEWEVMIRKLEMNEKRTTIGEMAANNSRRTEVFSKYGLDFCCSGDRTLHEACMEMGLDVQRIEEEIAEVDMETAVEEGADCNCMQLHALCDFIETKHHAYVRESIPAIEKLLVKIVEVHGDVHPHLSEILSAFRMVGDELSMHMQKEEMVLFPHIRELEKSAKNGTPAAIGRFPTIQMPINMMEAEHENAGNVMKEIRQHTSDYKLPEGACATFTEAYRKLLEFEKDLHTHIHLENNILFPKAIKLEAELNGDR